MGIIANLFGWFRMSENNNTESASTENSRPRLGYAFDSRPGWAITSRDLTGNLYTNYYSNNDPWTIPVSTGMSDLAREFERYMEERRTRDINRAAEATIKQGAKLTQINHFRDSVEYLAGSAPNISAEEVNKLASIIVAYGDLKLDAIEKDKVLQWLANVVEHCSHSTEEIEDDNSVDL